MATKNKSKKIALVDPLSRGASLPPASAADNPTAERDASIDLAFLTAELDKPVCGPTWEEKLNSLPEQGMSQDEKMLYASAAIKYGINRDEWISRALETSIEKQAAIERFLDEGVAESLPVATAIVNEISRWDEDDDPFSSARKIRVLIGHVERLFKQKPSRKAAFLDQITSESPDSTSFKVIIDAILDRDSPEAIAKRHSWFADATIPAPTLSLKEDKESGIISKYEDKVNHHESEDEKAGPEMDREPQEEKRDKPAEPSLEARRAAAFDVLMATVVKSGDYTAKAESLTTLSHELRQRVASELQTALIAKLNDGSIPHATYEQKKELVKWVNAELRRFDLDIVSPTTGKTSIFRANPGNHPDIGRFQLVSVDSDGTERTFSTPALPTLLSKFKLMLAPERREAILEWQEKVSLNRGGAKRE